MSVTIIEPVSQGTYNNWPLYAGASKVAALTDSSDSTCLTGEPWNRPGVGESDWPPSTPSPAESFILADASTLLAGKTIDQVYLITRIVKCNPPDPPIMGQIHDPELYWSPLLRLGSTDLFGAFSLVGQGPGTELVTVSWAPGRPGGGAWTAADFAALQGGIRFHYRGVSVPQPFITRLYGYIQWHDDVTVGDESQIMHSLF